jgi:signal transduction histidine kinase/DNA-binding response OmpR family regulator
MAADKSGNIWFGGERYYLYEFNAKTEKFRSIFPEIITSTDSLDYYTVNHLYIDQYNILWASTQKGILKIDISTGKIERIRSILGNQESLNDDTPAMILEDNNGLLWILGSKTGLSYYERDKKIFHAVPFPDQLNSVTYKVIKKDKNGNFWITHNAGFSRFNPLDFKTKCFNLPEKQAGSNVITLRCGELFFDNSEGDKRVFRFHVDSFNNNTYIPPVWIVKMTVNSREVSDILDWQQAGNENSLQFKYNENNITFEFTALNYTEPEKNQFRYYLSGIKRDTVDAGISRKAEFIGLPPGNYNFWVTGSNNDGLWNPSGTNVNFRISPPWYSTFIARLVYLIFLICLIIFIIKWRTNSLQREKLRLESVVLKRTEQIEEQKHNIELQQEKLLEMDEYKTRFFTNISHEFRSPLTIILGLSDDLLNKLQSRQITNEKLKHIWRNAKRLLGLVNQLLDVSKISSNKMKLELIETDIIDILRTLAASFSSLAESKMITFSYNLPIVTKLCFCDPDKIEKILINLLSNAFKFTPNGGKISIEAEYLNSEEFDSGVLKLKVADTGIGMTESDQKKIFDRFYQAEEHIKSAKGGTGIGLSLVKDLVQLMHGEISLSSKPGSGSIFTVSIPLGINHLSQDEYKLSKTLTESSEEESDSNSFIEIEYEIPEIKSATHKKLDISTLLVVEDNKDIRNYISENFRDSYNILEAYDGESGLITALQEMPDIIITDLMMPHLNGLEMCKKIKTDERTSHIPVIMLTAKAEIDDKLMGLKTGADDYLIKPFEMKELKVRVKNLIELRKKLRERFSREITIEPADITITPIDEKFLKKAISIVETHLSETDYDVEYLQQDMNMSRSTLSRKIKALTNYSPVEFIRFMRLKRAANLLDQGFGNVTEVAMEVGFNSPSYFAKWFKKTFGVSPLLFAKQKGISSN